jgi:hypothetical protein
MSKKLRVSDPDVSALIWTAGSGSGSRCVNCNTNFWKNFFLQICKNVLDIFSHEKKIEFLKGPQDNSIRVRGKKIKYQIRIKSMRIRNPEINGSSYYPTHPTCDGLAGPGILVGFHPGHAVVSHLLGQVGVQLLLRHIVSLLKQDSSHLILPSARDSKEIGQFFVFKKRKKVQEKSFSGLWIILNYLQLCTRYI